MIKHHFEDVGIKGLIKSLMLHTLHDYHKGRVCDGDMIIFFKAFGINIKKYLHFIK